MNEKNFLFIDLLSPIGHKNYDIGVLRCLSKLGSIDVLTRKNFLYEVKGLNINNVDYIPDEYIPELFRRKCTNEFIFKIKIRINQMKLLHIIKRKYKFENYDLIIFSSVEIISFSIMMHKYKGRCIFIDHGIFETTKSNVKKFFWRRINKNLDVIVMEEYIKEYVLNELKIKNNVHVFPHPLPYIDKKELKNISSINNKFIFSPGLETNKAFINEIIEKKQNIPNDFKFIIKGKDNINDENLIIYNKRISDEDYYNLIYSSEYILIAYEDDYNYRTSGVLFEALYLGKKILLKNNNTLINYKNKFKNYIFEFDTLVDLFEIIQRDESYKYIDKDDMYDDEINKYNDENLQKILNDIINL